MILVVNSLYADLKTDLKNKIDLKQFSDCEELININKAEISSSAELLFLVSKIMYHLDDLDQSNKFIIDAISKDNGNKEYREYKDSLDNFKKSIKNARKTFDSGNSELAVDEFEKIYKYYPEIIVHLSDL